MRHVSACCLPRPRVIVRGVPSAHVSAPPPSPFFGVHAPSQLQTAETTETTETTDTAGCVREVVGCQHAGLDCALWDATTRLGCHTTSLASGVYPVLCLCLCAKGLCALRLCA